MDTPRRGRGRVDHDVIHEIKALCPIHSYPPYDAEVCPTTCLLPCPARRKYFSITFYRARVSTLC